MQGEEIHHAKLFLYHEEYYFFSHKYLWAYNHKFFIIMQILYAYKINNICVGDIRI
jgi:hypothetical protein